MDDPGDSLPFLAGAGPFFRELAIKTLTVTEDIADSYVYVP